MPRFLRPFSLFFRSALFAASVKLACARMGPLYQARNPVMFVIYVCAILMSMDLVTYRSERLDPLWFVVTVTVILWFTVFFAAFAEAYAEGLAQKQADLLKGASDDARAKLLTHSLREKKWKEIPARRLKAGDLILIEAGDIVPADGTVIDGVATLNESAVTGESAPVVRESGSERDSVLAGSSVLSDWIVVKVEQPRGPPSLDKALSFLEGAKRIKTPDEAALGLFLLATTIVTLVTCATLYPFTLFSAAHTSEGAPVSVATLIALVVCLTPTTIGSLLSPIGLSGMRRLWRERVLATSVHAVEAAGEVDVLLLDKTGTITHGNRQASAFYPSAGVSMDFLAEAAFLASCADKTPEGRSITELAYRILGARPPIPESDFSFIPFCAETRASGITIGSTRAILKGATDVVESYVLKLGGQMPPDIAARITAIARQGGTPLAVADGAQVLGVIHLKDIVKEGIKERLSLLRRMGVQSVMITGDNPVTAAAIASEAGVDDFIAQATPETKLHLIRSMRADGRRIGMVGDGTNDAPALAQADLGIVMDSGTQTAKDAGNMIDLDSSPAKLAQIVWVGRQIAMTRGSLTTFSLASDLSKYLAILSAVFVHAAPSLDALNFLRLSTPHNAIVAALIFNALLIPALIPLALRGAGFKTRDPSKLLRDNLILYGGGGFFVSLIGLKAIDMILRGLTC